MANRPVSIEITPNNPFFSAFQKKEPKSDQPATPPNQVTKTRNSFYDKDKNFIDSITLDMAGVSPEDLGLSDLPTQTTTVINTSPRKKTIYKTVHRSTFRKDKKESKSEPSSPVKPSSPVIESPISAGSSPDKESKSKWRDAFLGAKKKKEHKKAVKANPMEMLKAEKFDSLIADALNYKVDDLKLQDNEIPQGAVTVGDYSKVESIMVEGQKAAADKENAPENQDPGEIGPTSYRYMGKKKDVEIM